MLNKLQILIGRNMNTVDKGFLLTSKLHEHVKQ